MDEAKYDKDAPATPEEQRMAEQIWDALRRLSPKAYRAGSPHNGDMEVSFDGRFNLLQFVREIARPIASEKQKSSFPEPR
jgi:hypothetical protein